MKKILTILALVVIVLLTTTATLSNVIGFGNNIEKIGSNAWVASSDKIEKEGNIRLNGNYTLHDRIVINGNGDYTPANGVTGGSGTEEDPYLIEGWEIDGGDVKEHLIDVQNTDAHFTIKNCYLHNTGYDFFGGGMGVYTDYVENMTVTDCLITDTYDGLQLHHTYDSRVYNNNFTLNRAHAITLAYSDHNILEYNSITEQQDDGILFGLLSDGAPSCNNIVRHNYIVDNNRYGLLIYRGTDNTAYNNVFKGNGDDHALDDAIDGDNNWNISTGGNWWHGHTSPDSDGDGFVDDPYDIPGFMNGDGDIDELPLAERPSVNYTAETTVELSLQPSVESNGWQFISIPVDPTDDSLDSVLNSIDGSYDKLMYYDSASGEWKTYVYGRADHFNSLNKINHTMSFWIHLTGSDTLKATGIQPSSTTISLSPGWNMVGYMGTDNVSADSSLPAEVTKVGVFDENEEYNVHYTADLSSVTLYQQHGYWVYNDADHAVDWTQ
ncbi:MAG: right-handed parallel beta-helix repeat-containing protein [Thermoplasmata archaeon]